MVVLKYDLVDFITHIKIMNNLEHKMILSDGNNYSRISSYSNDSIYLKQSQKVCSISPELETTDLWNISTKIEPRAKNPCHKNFIFCRLNHAMHIKVQDSLCMLYFSSKCDSLN